MESLRNMVKRHEGWRLTPYRCPAGKRTIAAGFNLDANTLPPEIASYLRLHGCITEEMAEQLLDMTISAATFQCKEIYGAFSTFTEIRQNALIDFVFNVGAGTALKFRRMIAAIKAGNWHAAADEMVDSDWFRQVGDRGPEIVGMIRKG